MAAFDYWRGGRPIVVVGSSTKFDHWRGGRPLAVVGGLPTITGTASLTLGALGVAATGTTTIVGTATVTLGALAVAATGTTTVVGTGAVTLGPLSVTADGTTTVTGVATVTLGALGVDATGTSEITGVASVTLGPLGVAAIGELPSSATVTLGPLSVQATGRVGIVPTPGTRSIARVTIVDVASFRFTVGIGARLIITPVLGPDLMPSTTFDFLLDCAQQFNPDLDVAQKNDDTGDFEPYTGIADVTMLLAASAGFSTPIAPSLTRTSAERPEVPGRIHPEPPFTADELQAALIPDYEGRVIFLNLFRDGEVYFQSFKILVRRDRIGPA